MRLVESCGPRPLSTISIALVFMALPSRDGDTFRWYSTQDCRQETRLSCPFPVLSSAGASRASLSRGCGHRHFPCPADPRGVIRHKWVGAPGEKAIDTALETLINEAKVNGKKSP